MLAKDQIKLITREIDRTADERPRHAAASLNPRAGTLKLRLGTGCLTATIISIIIELSNRRLARSTTRYPRR